jgi:hypothetical protein
MVASLDPSGGSTLYIKVEVRDEKQVQGVVAEVVKESGRRGSWQS